MKKMLAMMMASPVKDKMPPSQSRRRERFRSVPSSVYHAPDMHRLRDILDNLFAKVLEFKRQLVLDLLINSARDADAPGSARFSNCAATFHSVAVDARQLRLHRRG
jgi:hypothetical protein